MAYIIWWKRVPSFFPQLIYFQVLLALSLPVSIIIVKKGKKLSHLLLYQLPICCTMDIAGQRTIQSISFAADPQTSLKCFFLEFVQGSTSSVLRIGRCFSIPPTEHLISFSLHPAAQTYKLAFPPWTASQKCLPELCTVPQWLSLSHFPSQRLWTPPQDSKFQYYSSYPSSLWNQRHFHAMPSFSSWEHLPIHCISATRTPLGSWLPGSYVLRAMMSRLIWYVALLTGFQALFFPTLSFPLCAPLAYHQRPCFLLFPFVR